MSHFFPSNPHPRPHPNPEREPFPPVSEPMIESVLKELWGAGGPLDNMALSAVGRPATVATQLGGEIDRQLAMLAHALAAIFVTPFREGGVGLSRPSVHEEASSPPPRLAACLPQPTQ